MHVKSKKGLLSYVGESRKMVNQRLLEKKKYSFEELISLISQNGTVYLQDLVESELEGDLHTLFLNHSFVIRDVEELSFITYEDHTYIHGIIDVYDRVFREKLYNSDNPRFIANDPIADMIIRSNVVINVIELNVSNYIQEKRGKLIPLKNKYLVEIYTDWHTQMHHMENKFFKYFFA